MPQKLPPWILPITILFLALFFRTARLDLIEFKADEAINLLLASQPLFGHAIPSGGTVSSVGILNPPLFNFFLLPALFLSKSPIVISMYIGIINALSVLFLYLAFNKYHGKLVAAISCILLSVSFWPVLFSRKIWTQDIIFPLTVLLLFCFYKITYEKKQHFWMLYGLITVLLLQIHQSTIIFLVILSLHLVRFLTKSRALYIVTGLLVGSLFLIPYIIYQLQFYCPDCSAFLHGGAKSVSSRILVFQRLIHIVGQGGLFFIMGENIADFSNKYSFLYQSRIVLYANYFLIPLGMIRLWKNTKARPFIITSIALPTLYLILRIEPHMHYYIILAPFLFLFIASGLSWIITSKNPLIHISGIALSLLLITVSALFTLSFFHYLSIKKELKGDYGSVFAQSQQFVRNDLKDLLRQKDFDEIFLTAYIPKNSIYGDIAVGRILYSQAINTANATVLFEQFEKSPKDPRTQNALIAHFTVENPKTNIKALHKKTLKPKSLPQYTLVNNTILEYLRYRGKKIFDSQGMWFIYPETWKIHFGDYRITLTRDDAFLTIHQYPAEINGQVPTLVSRTKSERIELFNTPTTIYHCFTSSGLWCGSEVDSVIQMGFRNAITAGFSSRKQNYTKEESLDYLKDIRAILSTTIH